MMVRVFVTVLVFGVTVVGLNVQPARAGNPLHGEGDRACKRTFGVTVSVNVPDCPAVTVALLGLEVRVKSSRSLSASIPQRCSQHCLHRPHSRGHRVVSYSQARRCIVATPEAFSIPCPARSARP